MGITKKLVDGIYNLLLGLKVTGGCLPKPAVTLQYPDERWEMPERSRGIVVLLSDKQTGKLNCTACLLCQKACPTGAITIERDKGEDKKWFPVTFAVDNTICCFCGLCEEACNFAAVKMATKYEFSVFDQSELVFDMHKLQELGRDVPYTPIPKKKPAVKKITPAKPASADKGSDKEATEKKSDEEAKKLSAAAGEAKSETKKDPGPDLFDGAKPVDKPESAPGDELKKQDMPDRDKPEAKE